MSGIEGYACEGTLTISSISMNRPAWACVGDENGRGGLLGLLTEGEQRGQDRLLPNTTGFIAYRRRLTVTTHEIRLIVVGDVDVNGADTADDTEGLIDNLDYLYTNIVTPVVSSTGTRAATVVLPGLASRSANLHVVGMRQDEYHLGTGAVWVGALMLSIPAGRFA